MHKYSPSAFRALALPRPFLCPQAIRAHRALHSQAQRTAHTSARFLVAATAGTLAGFIACHGLEIGGDVHAEARIVPREQATNLSLQHLQVESALANPGVYAWGDNSGKVIAPDSKEKVIKTPRRLPFFDGVLLRDLQLGQDAGVAVNEKGDVLQWGIGYSDGTQIPETTFKGKNIERVVLSKDKVIALSKDKTIYSFPIAKEHQLSGKKPSESSWIPGLSSTSDISYRILKPKLRYFETVKDITAGREHLLVLTSDGRVFSSAAAFFYPSRGQMGIPGLRWETRPVGKPVDTLQEIASLSSYKISQIAAGDYHSAVLSSTGEVFTFGDNIHGQLGFEFNPETSIYDVPTLLTLTPLYPTKSTTAKITSITAGGMNTYLQVDVTDPNNCVSSEVLSCGIGIYGSLGNGHWTHTQGTPTKIKALSNLHEFNEATQATQPIRLGALLAGANHAAAIMSTSTTSDFGADVLVWGNNEFYQLGTGKRNNSSVPVYIQPLDGVPAAMLAGTKSFTGGSSHGKIARPSGISGGVGGVENARVMSGNQVNRFQVASQGKTKGGKKVAQTVVCGRGNSAVFVKAL